MPPVIRVIGTRDPHGLTVATLRPLGTLGFQFSVGEGVLGKGIN